MRIEQTNTFPVPLKDGFDFLRDIAHWPYWYSGITEIRDAPASGTWAKPGDAIWFSYQLLGRRLDGQVVLEEMREYDLVRSITVIPNLSPVRQEYWYTGDDERSFVLRVVLETEGVATLLGRSSIGCCSPASWSGT